MTPARALFLACLIFSLPVAAQPSADSVKKKLDLAVYYLESGTVSKIEQSDSELAKSHLQRFRSLIEQAQAAYAAGDYQRTSDDVSNALQAMSAASAALRQSRQPSGQTVKRNQELRQEIQSYRTSFIYGAREKGPSAAALLDLELLDKLLHRAETSTSKGDHAQSRKLLEEAYQMTVSAVASLRQNDTVVYSLDFQTPADEFRYEADRYKGYEILIDQLVAAGKSEGQAGKLVERYVGEGEKLKSEASQLAAAGHYDQAIKTMEDANRSLARALQMMGVPIPGG